MEQTDTISNRMLWLLALAFAAGFAGVSSARAGEALTFEKNVRPIFKAYCLDCHGGGESLKGKLDLRLKRFAERGGKNGPAIVAGQPGESLLVERLKSGEIAPRREEGSSPNRLA